MFQLIVGRVTVGNGHKCIFAIQVAVAQIILYGREVAQRVQYRQVAARVTGLKLIVEVLRRLVKAPAVFGTGAGKNSGKCSSRKAESFAIVAHLILHILYLEYRLDAVLTLQEEVCTIICAKVILVLRDNGVAPCLGSSVVVAVKIYFQQHGLGCTLRGTAQILGRIGVFLPQCLLGKREVVDDMAIHLLGRGARLLPLGGRVYDEIDIRHAAKDTYQTEIIESAQERCLTKDALLQRDIHRCVGLHLSHLVEHEVATGDTLILRTIEAEQQSIV